MEKQIKKVNKNKKDVKTNKLKDILNKIGMFFNNPKPLFIGMCIVLVILMYMVIKQKNNGNIFVGSISDDTLSVSNIHYFNNEKINYFFAANAVYSGEDKKVYSYQVGYIVKDKNGKEYEFAVRSGSVDNAVSISEIVLDMSSWNFGEPSSNINGSNVRYFTNEVMKNLENLYFVVRGSTDSDNLNNFDIDEEYQVDVIDLMENK